MQQNKNWKVLHTTFTCHVWGEGLLGAKARNRHEYFACGYKDPFNLDVEGFTKEQHIDGSCLQYDVDRISEIIS